MSMRWTLLPCLAWTALAAAAGDPLGWHHSPATQITPDNVNQLERVWTHRNGDMAAAQGAPSATITAEEALRLKVIDFVATDLNRLMEQMEVRKAAAA